MFAYAKPEQKQIDKSAVQKKERDNKSTPNLTGIPDAMKTHFENLSGLSFSDVRVHYNSDKPAQFQALAYTQGNNVYIELGQERHLGHELGHVVQQKQGIVKATANIDGVSVNNDSELERAADNRDFGIGTSGGYCGNVVQGAFIEGSDFKKNIEDQKIIQENVTSLANDSFVSSANELTDYNPEQLTPFAQDGAVENIPTKLKEYKIFYKNKIAPFTTVGLEHEFAKYDSPHMKNLTHVVLAKSSPCMKYTGLGFSLETDSNCKVEFVSPPFLIETGKSPVPVSNTVVSLNTNMEKYLLTKNKGSLLSLVNSINSELNIDLNLDPAIYAKVENIEENSQFTPDTDHDTFVKNFKISTNEGLVNPQINFATDAKTYQKMLSEKSVYGSDVFESKCKAVTSLLVGLDYLKKEVFTRNLLATRQLARSFAQIPFQCASEYLGTLKFEKMDLLLQKKDIDESKKKEIILLRHLSSVVKDFGRVWLKDSVLSYIRGIVTEEEVYDMGYEIFFNMSVISSIISLSGEDIKQITMTEPSSNIINIINKKNFEYTQSIINNLKSLQAKKEYIGARPDTFIDLQKEDNPHFFKNSKMHVAELRTGGFNTEENARAIKFYLDKGNKGS